MLLRLSLVTSAIRVALELILFQHNGGEMVVIDGLESLPQVSSLSTQSIAAIRSDCLERLSALASTLTSDTANVIRQDLLVEIKGNEVKIGGFGTSRGSLISKTNSFHFDAPTTALNAMRVLRGCQLPKAILLEGSPGVGKTSLISALAGLTGHQLRRINFSDQTDLIDLFGSDLPVEGGQAGEFQWRDAAFLDAMQNGNWVLLDEMNLASQTVLEGLNAVLDHRGTVFIPELGRSFVRHPDFRVFAAQNPLQQGGGRKGLPKSFMNRFTKVYLQEFIADDLMLICRDLHRMPLDLVQKMIAFNERIRDVTMRSKIIGQEGSPWDFNLRDLFRWFQLLSSPNGLEISSHPVEHFHLVYGQRFRNDRDRQTVSRIFLDIFGEDVNRPRAAPFITPEWLQIGHSLMQRDGSSTINRIVSFDHLDVAESVLKCVEMGWLVILAGESGGGKRSLVRCIAEAAGRSLGEFAMHPGVDTSEILGSFEQQDVRRLLRAALDGVNKLIDIVSDDEPAFATHSASVRSAYEGIKPGKEENLAEFLRIGQDIIKQASSGIYRSAAMIALDNLEKAGPNVTGFTWVDGELLGAVRHGGWFLISDANLCSASVLDRLNSLCESNGFLVMSEKGSSTKSPEIVKPHPDFRLFMTYDPRHGELSRAMRNRGVELYIDRLHAHSEVWPVGMSLALSDQSSIKSIVTLDSAWSTQGNASDPLPTASLIANQVAQQNVTGMAILRHFGSSAGTEYDDQIAAALSFSEAESVQNAVREQRLRITEVQHLPQGFKVAMVSLFSSARFG